MHYWKEGVWNASKGKTGIHCWKDRGLECLKCLKREYKNGNERMERLEWPKLEDMTGMPPKIMETEG